MVLKSVSAILNLSLTWATILTNLNIIAVLSVLNISIFNSAMDNAWMSCEAPMSPLTGDHKMPLLISWIHRKCNFDLFQTQKYYFVIVQFMGGRWDKWRERQTNFHTCICHSSAMNTTNWWPNSVLTVYNFSILAPQSNKCVCVNVNCQFLIVQSFANRSNSLHHESDLYINALAIKAGIVNLSHIFQTITDIYLKQFRVKQQMIKMYY